MSNESTKPDLRPLLSYRDLALLFYLGVPTVFGLSLGWQGAGQMAGHFTKPISLLYWIGATNLVWISLEAGTRTIAFAAPKNRTPLVVLLVLGGLVQPLIGRPLISLWQYQFTDFLPVSVEPPALPFTFGSPSEYWQVVQANLFIISVWVAFNLLFDRLLRFPRFRRETGHTSSSSETTETSHPLAGLVPSGFLHRLPATIGRDVIALSAEDHYVRVYTRLGDDLVLYRFSDAVREMPDGSGLQVHRSHWVNLDAITNFEAMDRSHLLTINDTISIPVSQRYIEVLKSKGVNVEHSRNKTKNVGGKG